MHPYCPNLSIAYAICTPDAAAKHLLSILSLLGMKREIYTYANVLWIDCLICDSNQNLDVGSFLINWKSISHLFHENQDATCSFNLALNGTSYLPEWLSLIEITFTVWNPSDMTRSWSLIWLDIRTLQFVRTPINSRTSVHFCRYRTYVLNALTNATMRPCPNLQYALFVQFLWSASIFELMPVNRPSI